jgi:sugar O-acyltransferase (sialic acid O-acetyltransferase NeuD family)
MLLNDSNIVLIGYSPNMISMILDNLHSQGYNQKLWVINNELKEIVTTEDVWHPHIEVIRKDISETSQIDFLFKESNLLPFMGVYKSNSKREMHSQFCEFLTLSPNIIHKNIEISASTRLGLGNMLNTGVVIAGHSTIGNFCSINRNSSIGHHTQIGNFCTINPNSTICGSIKIEDNVTIGASATIIDGLTIGKNSIIGAGSVVINDVPPNSVVMGVPGKIVKTLS